MYCVDHRMGRDHECSEEHNHGSLYLLVCSKCDQKIRIDVSDKGEEIFRLHEMSGQCKPENKKAKKHVKCLAKGCGLHLTEFNSKSCDKCRQRVCFSHRFPEQHSCMGRPPSKLTDPEFKRNASEFEN